MYTPVKISCNICFDKGLPAKCYFCGKKRKVKKKYKTNEEINEKLGREGRVKWLKELWQTYHDLNFKTSGDPGLDREIKNMYGEWLC